MSAVADSFRDAWLSLESGDESMALDRMSLEAMTMGNPELEEVLADLRAPLQAELDVHLSGDRITGHEARASDFGVFVSRTAIAVKEIAKSLAGRERMATDLRVLAPAPGSVRVIFRAPPVEHHQAVIPGDTDGDSIDSLAVKRLATLFDYSENESEDSPLVASLRSLRGPARMAVGRVARTVSDAGWDIDGFLRQQGLGTQPLRLSHGAATRLHDAATNDVTDVQVVTSVGTIDGHRMSVGRMWFQPEAGRSFEASVPTADLLKAVVALGSRPEQAVRARFDVFISYATGDVEHASRSRALTAIEAIEPPEPML